jgi:5-enolpyruvylshikimate-3-phosphate synthase
MMEEFIKIEEDNLKVIYDVESDLSLKKYLINNENIVSKIESTVFKELNSDIKNINFFKKIEKKINIKAQYFENLKIIKNKKKYFSILISIIILISFDNDSKNFMVNNDDNVINSYSIIRSCVDLLSKFID